MPWTLDIKQTRLRQAGCFVNSPSSICRVVVSNPTNSRSKTWPRCHHTSVVWLKRNALCSSCIYIEEYVFVTLLCMCIAVPDVPAHFRLISFKSTHKLFLVQQTLPALHFSDEMYLISDFSTLFTSLPLI